MNGGVVLPLLDGLDLPPRHAKGRAAGGPARDPIGTGEEGLPGRERVGRSSCRVGREGGAGAAIRCFGKAPGTGFRR